MQKRESAARKVCSGADVPGLGSTHGTCRCVRRACGRGALGSVCVLAEVWVPGVVGLAVSLPIFCPTVHGLHTRGLAAWINPHPHPTHSMLSTCARALYIRFSSPLLWLGQKEKELVREEQQKDHL